MVEMEKRCDTKIRSPTLSRNNVRFENCGRSQLGSFSEPRRKKWARFTRILEKIGAGPVCGISRLWDTYGNVDTLAPRKSLGGEKASTPRTDPELRSS